MFIQILLSRGCKSQKEQFYGFPPHELIQCVKLSSIYSNIFNHKSGYLSKWTDAICFFKLPLCEKFLLQIEHLKDVFLHELL